MLITITIVVLAFVLTYLFLMKGRTGHKDLPALRGWYYAHRGLHSQGVPENSMAAFCAAKEAGYGVELDIHLMQDGNLAVIHDSSLKRTAGADVIIEDLAASQLCAYPLEGTPEHIPLFSQVLDLFEGEVPLIVELKPHGNNCAALCQAACDILDNYQGIYCLESFDPRCISWLRKHRKDLVRGQLSENFLQSEGNLPWALKFVLKYHLLNVFTRPDFVAYRFADRKNLSNFVCRRFWGLLGIAWTITNQEDLDTAAGENWIPIFENFKP